MESKSTGRNRSWLIGSIAAVIVLGAIGYWFEFGRAADGSRGAPSAAAGAQPELLGPRGQAATASPTARQPSNATQSVAASAPAPLPLPGTPLAPIYGELKARADAGDAAAASRLFRDILGCQSARAKLNIQPILLEHALTEDTSKLGEKDLRQRDAFLGDMENELRTARKAVAVCVGLTAEQLQATPIVLRAAQLGDDDAANCYVSAFPLISRGLVRHPEWVAEYRDNALAIAQAAVERGDWSMVDNLQQAYAQTESFGLLGELTGADAVQSYRYLRLERLGAAGGIALELDRRIAATGRELSPSDIEAAANWAETTYRRYFAAYPERKTPSEPSLCFE